MQQANGYETRKLTHASDLHDISLRQALHDFERANARVLDLTQRLVQAESKWRNLAQETERLRQLLANLAPAPPRQRRSLARRTARLLLRLGAHVLRAAK